MRECASCARSAPRGAAGRGRADRPARAVRRIGPRRASRSAYRASAPCYDGIGLRDPASVASADPYRGHSWAVSHGTGQPTRNGPAPSTAGELPVKAHRPRWPGHGTHTTSVRVHRGEPVQPPAAGAARRRAPRIAPSAWMDPAGPGPACRCQPQHRVAHRDRTRSGRHIGLGPACRCRPRSRLPVEPRHGQPAGTRGRGPPGDPGAAAPTGPGDWIPRFIRAGAEVRGPQSLHRRSAAQRQSSAPPRRRGVEHRRRHRRGQAVVRSEAGRDRCARDRHRARTAVRGAWLLGRPGQRPEP